MVPHRERHRALRVPHPVAPQCERHDRLANGDGAEESSGRRVPKKEAWPFYRTSSGVRLCWELEEPKGPSLLPEKEKAKISPV